jgi:hypothetical protein
MKHLALVIAVLAFFVLGCGFFNRLANSSTNVATNDGSTTSSKPTSGDAAPPSGDPRADVIAASKKFIALPKFSAKMDGMGKTELHTTLDYQAPDRYHMLNLSNSQQQMNEFIIIGKDMYMQFGGRWQKMPGAVGASMPNLRKMFDEEGLKRLQDVEYIGDDTLDGRPAHIYSYHSTQTDSTVPNPFTSKIWIGADDGLPQKIEVTYDGGDLKTMTIAYDYEKSIDIKPPV